MMVRSRAKDGGGNVTKINVKADTFRTKKKRKAKRTRKDGISSGMRERNLREGERRKRRTFGGEVMLGLEKQLSCCRLRNYIYNDSTLPFLYSAHC